MIFESHKWIQDYSRVNASICVNCAQMEETSECEKSMTVCDDSIAPPDSWETIEMMLYHHEFINVKYITLNGEKLYIENGAKQCIHCSFQHIFTERFTCLEHICAGRIPNGVEIRSSLKTWGGKR